MSFYRFARRAARPASIAALVCCSAHTVLSYGGSSSGSFAASSSVLAGLPIRPIHCDAKAATVAVDARSASIPVLSDAAASAPLNPFLQQSGTPLFSQLRAEDVQDAVQRCIDDQRAAFRELEASLSDPRKGSAWSHRRIPFDYDMVVEGLERLQAPLTYTWGLVDHLMAVKNSEALRKAHDAMQSAVVTANQEIGQSKVLFHALQQLKENPQSWETLDEAQRRVVDASINQMLRSGVGLSDEKREHFNKLQLEVSELSSKFSNNLLDSTKRFKKIVTSEQDVAGLPESARSLAAQKAVAEGHAGATASAGPWVLTLDPPSYLPCMQHLKSRELRETLYRAFVTRASSDDVDNSKIIQRILQIRKEMAQMLGYNSYAELSLSSKMAPTVASVLQLSEMLREKAYPSAEQELGALLAFARAQGFQGERLQVWDVPFWSERLRESKYGYEEEQLRPYFPLENVLTGLFSLAERLFSVKIEAADGQAEVWCPDVRFFNVREAATGAHIASFYLDPYSRPAEKRGGAWMNICLQKSRAMQRIPVAYLVCNGSPPVADKPSLMTFSEVQTLFHEFGHGLQHMLTRVEYGDAAGIGNVEWDAVELPSQFMENWCLDKPTVDGFAKHYKTGESLPIELFEKIKAAKNYNAGMMMIRQLFFGGLDMELHSNYDPYGQKSPFDVQHELAPKFTVVPPIPEDRFLCSFSHLFAGGYAAGYYSYKWAEVMSADAFAAFEEAGLHDEAAVRAVGMRFRDTVLAMGGGKHPSGVFRAFRGRDPEPAALLRHSGLIPEEEAMPSSARDGK